MKRSVIAIFSTLAIIMACDNIEEPLKDGFGFIDLPETNKTILIEEFTGVQCTFCPDGARQIKGYVQAAPNNVIPVAIHASNFAIPFPGDENLATQESQDFYVFMGRGGLPGGLFDRDGFPDEVFKNPALWDDLLQERLSIPAQFNITGELNYNQADSTFNLRTNVLALEDYSGGPINLTAYLLEDSIVTLQLDNGVIDSNYVQNHVFRTSFAGMTGEQIAGGNASKDQIFVNNTSVKVDPGRFRINKCSAVMFIYNTDTQEVLQAGHAFHN